MNILSNVTSPEKIQFIDRLIEVVTALGYPEHGRQAQLARRYKLKQPSVHKWFTGDAMPGYEICQDLCKRSLVNFDWFMTGRGDKFVVLTPLSSDPRIEHAVRIMEHMEDWQLDQAVKIIDTIAEPAKRAGNGVPD